MFIKSEVVWLKNHAQPDAEGAWWCKTTKKPNQTAVVGRSLHFAEMRGAGSGEVRRITHLACAGCEPNKVPPEHGLPINDNELVERI